MDASLPLGVALTTLVTVDLDRVIVAVTLPDCFVAEEAVEMVPFFTTGALVVSTVELIPVPMGTGALVIVELETTATARAGSRQKTMGSKRIVADCGLGELEKHRKMSGRSERVVIRDGSANVFLICCWMKEGRTSLA